MPAVVPAGHRNSSGSGRINNRPVAAAAPEHSNGFSLQIPTYQSSKHLHPDPPCSLRCRPTNPHANMYVSAFFFFHVCVCVAHVCWTPTENYDGELVYEWDVYSYKTTHSIVYTLGTKGKIKQKKMKKQNEKWQLFHALNPRDIRNKRGRDEEPIEPAHHRWTWAGWTTARRAWRKNKRGGRNLIAGITVDTLPCCLAL